ncbi:MAG: oligosaccharide flippase family protein [Rikenellaceae bacterium]
MLRKLLSQTAVYGISATVAKFLNYLLTPLLTRVLSEDVYGEMSYLYAIIPFANVLLTMGFSTGYFRFAAQCENQAERKRLFSTLWSSVSLFSLVLCGVIAALFPSPATITMAALILVDNISSIPLSMLREQGKALRYTIINITGVVINVVLCFSFYTYIDGASSSAVWVLLANLAASLGSLLLLLPSCIRMFTSKVDFTVLKRVAKYSYPLMVAGIMGVASDFIDRQMLRWLLPEDIALSQLGIYSAVAKIAALMVIFRQIYTLGAEPFFLQKFSKEDFGRLNAAALKYFTAIGIIIFLAIMLYSDIFALILGSDFREGMTILPLLLFSNLLAGVLVNLSFWYKVADKTKIAVIVTISGISISLALNLTLIPLYGYNGAAWARVGATFAMVLLSYLLGQKYYPVRYDMRSLALYTALGAIIFTLSHYTALIEPSLARWSINFVLFAIFCIIFVKKEGFWGHIKRLIHKS